MFYSKIPMERIVSTYLNGEILKNVEEEKNIFYEPEKLLLMGYEMFGSEDEHSLFEKYYAIGSNKGFTFKVYFYKNIPWSSGISFWRFKLDPVLFLAKSSIKNIKTFFDRNGFGNGAFIVNGFCVFRFEFIKNKYPRVLTLETDIATNAIMDDCRITTNSVFNQFSAINSCNYYEDENVRKIFEMISKHCPQALIE